MNKRARLLLPLVTLFLFVGAPVSAASDTVPVGSNRLHLHFVIPSNLSTFPDSNFTDNECIGFTGGRYSTLIQGCRFLNSALTTDLPSFLDSTKYSIIHGGGFVETGTNHTETSDVSINGIDGMLHLFFYNDRNFTNEKANFLFIGAAGDDYVAFLLQTSLSNPNGADLFKESLDSFDAFS